jgi:hypothetical protein
MDLLMRTGNTVFELLGNPPVRHLERRVLRVHASGSSTVVHQELPDPLPANERWPPPIAVPHDVNASR